LDELSYNLLCIYVIPLSIAEVGCECKMPVEVDCPEATRVGRDTILTGTIYEGIWNAKSGFGLADKLSRPLD
jgi:hypothetical protein